MMLEDELCRIFKNREIEEFYSVGYVEIDSGRAEYICMNNLLFIEVDNQYMRLESVENDWRLKIDFVRDIEYPEDSVADLIKAKTKVGNYILASGTEFRGQNYVEKIYLYNWIDKTSNICDALELKLKNGQCIFIDPRFFGIKIGNESQKHIWFDNYGENVNINSVSI